MAHYGSKETASWLKRLVGQTASSGNAALILTFKVYVYDIKWYCYEGRPINKLQNGTIQNIKKIRNIGFVRNLILNNSCEFYCDDVTVTSFVNDKDGDATAESIP